MIPEKGSIHGVARATGHDKNALIRWLDIAGAPCKEITDLFVQDLELSRVQVDDVYTLTALKSFRVSVYRLLQLLHEVHNPGVVTGNLHGVIQFKFFELRN